MRTTVRLPDDLYDQVRATVSARGLTVTAFLEEALRRALVEPEGASGEPYRVRPFRGHGLQPGVDLDDSAALSDLMDDDARA